MPQTLTREDAFALLNEYTKTEHLITHALSVEGVMRHFAALQNEDAEKWGVVGLLHDLDYDQFPGEHCIKVQEILRERGIGEEIIHAVASHGYGLCCDVKPEAFMEKVLYTVDELTGLITACALLRPSKSVLDMEVKSVKKKMKTKGFAAGVNREVIQQGAEMMGWELGDVIAETIQGMRRVAPAIGLQGNLPME
ncbi:HD domain-containing protein [Oscillospiraceae bacterium NSJ-54]|uniref:HD domain-containing protein n=2 Tax=Zongyangia hominis TaxID=2763677 RepID=A0A926EER7_9FIRM|nr:HD domain-containing protein [Zongyangia hominis]MBC8571114.1 HD domain-containing protein [Zongyangia hominis]